MGSPGSTASRLGSLRGKAAARETHAFVEKLKIDLQEAQAMLEVSSSSPLPLPPFPPPFLLPLPRNPSQRMLVHSHLPKLESPVKMSLESVELSLGLSSCNTLQENGEVGKDMISQ